MEPFSISAFDILGVPNPPGPPQGSDTNLAPALPANAMTPGDTPSMIDAASLIRGAQATAGPVHRWPLFGSVVLMAIGVMIVGVAAKVAADV